VKKYDFGEDLVSRKLVRRKMKERVVGDESIFSRLKILLLLRERDRTTRENSIKVIKKLLKFTKKITSILLA
jgi:hypothetical protein